MFCSHIGVRYSEVKQYSKVCSFAISEYVVLHRRVERKRNAGVEMRHIAHGHGYSSYAGV
jgi:hypothetical protein